jgi:general secretion pathway protein A
MYLKYFGLAERPFSITPDPRFLYMSQRHREALAHLIYGVGEDGGFVQLTGEVGTGKTTVCRCLLEQLPEDVDVALILNPRLTAEELIATICDELQIEYPRHAASIKSLTDALNNHLLAAHAGGRRTVLLIDEAQNLSVEVLEQVRLLTNLETATRKLFQIILIGQPELRGLLGKAELRQLAQRVTARYHLEPLSRTDCEAYITHRLRVCGATRRIFTKRAIERIRHYSGGVPRLINVLCDRAMLGAYVEGKATADTRIVSRAAREVLPLERTDRETQGWLPVAAVSLASLLVVAVVSHQPWMSLTGRPAAGGDGTIVRVDGETGGAPAGEEMMVAEGGQVAGVDVRLNEPPGVESPVEPLAEQQTLGFIATGNGSAGQEGPVADTVGADHPDLGAVLSALEGTNYNQAWRDMFVRWSLDVPAGGNLDFCSVAAQNGLRCLMHAGTWNSLRHFDRPALLQLIKGDGTRVTAMLQALDEDVAELAIGDRSYRIPVQEVDQYWFGDYTLLWRLPPQGTEIIRPGDRGMDVKWLREQIERIGGARLPADDPLYFDDTLRREIVAFQRGHALVSDGVVGKRTMILINSVSGQPGIPRVSAPTLPDGAG